jgi:hypothetical protein
MGAVNLGLHPQGHTSMHSDDAWTPARTDSAMNPTRPANGRSVSKLAPQCAPSTPQMNGGGRGGGGGGKRHNCTGSIRPVGAQRAADLQSLLVRRNCARHVPCFVRCLSTTAGFVRGRVPVGRLQHRHGK